MMTIFQPITKVTLRPLWFALACLLLSPVFFAALLITHDISTIVDPQNLPFDSH